MRPTFLAGTWYPAAADACRAAIQRHAADTAPKQASWRGVIVPHASWRYSGDVAAKTFAWLAAAQYEEITAPIDLVVVFGSHRGPQGPNSILRAAAWDTPLGPLPCVVDLASELATAWQLSEEPVRPRHPDNGIELVLPFVRYFFPRASGLMLGVAAASSALEIGAAVGALCKSRGLNAVFVGSTDLTHYGPRYDFSPQGDGPAAQEWVRRVNDRGFLAAAERLDAAALLQHGCARSSACCPGAAAAAVRAVQEYSGGVPAALVQHSLSCDVEPSPNYVGYAGVVF